MMSRSVMVLSGVAAFSIMAPSPLPLFSASPEPDKGQEQVELAFKYFNPSVPQKTIDKFMDVTSAYGLDRDGVFDACIHQICFESAAKQSAISPSGAMGLGQITPTTAFHVLHSLDQTERARMRQLGASGIQWALNGRYSSKTTPEGKVKKFLAQPLRSQAIKWLDNPVNNLILWGHIMHENLRTMDVDRAFLAYHLGNGGILRYKHDPEKHPYIAGMDRVAAVLAKKKGVI